MPPQAKPTSVLAQFQDASGPFFGSVCPIGAIKKYLRVEGPAGPGWAPEKWVPKTLNCDGNWSWWGFTGDFLNEKLRMPLIKGLGRLVWPKT